MLTRSSHDVSGFDSILVRLKVSKRWLYYMTVQSFDSILVRLKVRKNASAHREYPSFDSILVRLKDENYVFSIRCCWFRFHTGSIKRAVKCNACWCVSFGFDSILVRLKAFRATDGRVSYGKFRFHTGSIKRALAWLFRYTRLCFDSILVRLKVELNLYMSLTALFRFHTGSIKSSCGH